VTVTGEAVGYRAPPKSLMATTLMANPTNVLRSRTPARLYVYDTILERLAYNLKHMAFEFSLLVSAPKPVMGQGRQFRGRFPDHKLHVLEIPRQPSEESVI
jgi:hypothetical protein